MGHVAFLCGVVVFLGLPLLLQSLCEDLQGAGMAPGGSLGSSGVVTNEIHTQAWPLGFGTWQGRLRTGDAGWWQPRSTAGVCPKEVGRLRHRGRVRLLGGGHSRGIREAADRVLSHKLFPVLSLLPLSSSLCSSQWASSLKEYVSTFK